MKILIVGSDNIWAIENTYIKHLKNNNEVSFFNAHGIFLDYYHKTIINKLKYRLGISSILKKINSDLLKIVSKKQLDVIWVFKGMEIYPKTLLVLKEKGIVLVNYNGDHPFKFTSRGTGNQNVVKSIPLYDHHFSYSKKIVNDLIKKYQVNCSWLPYGYHTSVAPQHNSIKKVCFIGNPDEERIRIIQLLIEKNIEVDVFGIGWEKIVFNESITINGPIFNDEFNSTAQNYRVLLNVFRPHNKGSHNMRTFEMPALGCLMLAPYSEEHLELFNDNKEVFYYKNDEELIKKCNFILSLHEDEVFQIGLNAFNRSVNSKYSYKDRANEVMNCFKKLVIT